MSSVAALVSGGLDSAVLVAALARRRARVVPIHLRQGLAWEAAERYWLRRWLRVFPRGRVAPLVTLALPVADLYRGHWSVTGVGVPSRRAPDAAVYLPGRNLFLVVKAAVYCAERRIPRLALGTLKGNPFDDAAPAFRRAIACAVRIGLGVPFEVIAPLASWTKARVIRQGRRWQVPLALTFSCIRPRGRRPCGCCQKCEERRRGFEQAGIDEHAL